MRNLIRQCEALSRRSAEDHRCIIDLRVTGKKPHNLVAILGYDVVKSSPTSRKKAFDIEALLEEMARWGEGSKGVGAEKLSEGGEEEKTTQSVVKWHNLTAKVTLFQATSSKRRTAEIYLDRGIISHVA